MTASMNCSESIPSKFRWRDTSFALIGETTVKTASKLGLRQNPSIKRAFKIKILIFKREKVIFHLLK